MFIRHEPHSNAMDFRPDTLQFVAYDDGGAMWGTLPAGTTASVTIADQSGLVVLTHEHGDGSGAVTIRDDGFFDIAIPASQMASFSAGMHSVAAKIVMDGVTVQVFGVLPIYESAKPWF